MSGPSAALAALDSLLEAGRLEEARRLCAGQVLRMFDFLAMSHAKMAPLVDSARSREETLEERTAGDWAYVKVSSRMVFKRPFLGQDSMRAIQAVHLYRSARGWLVAEMEELEGERDTVALRTGVPEGAAGARPADAGMFPISPRAPSQAGEADRLRLRIRLKNGDDLAGLCPLGPVQRRLRAVSPSEWILETRRGRISATKRGPPSPGSKPPDSLARYLASGPQLALEDSLLRSTAARIAGGETEPGRVTGLVYDWVMEHFRFELGAVLFGTSREILRGLKGDCSEAAVLTAALLRSRGVPARVVLGFASLGKGVFIGHAWCEAWVGGGWTGVDAALKEYPAGAERIKMAELDGGSDMRIAATNLMLRAMANLEIEILSASKAGRELPLRDFGDRTGEARKFFREILKGLDAGAAP